MVPLNDVGVRGAQDSRKADERESIRYNDLDFALKPGLPVAVCKSVIAKSCTELEDPADIGVSFGDSPVVVECGKDGAPGEKVDLEARAVFLSFLPESTR